MAKLQPSPQTQYPNCGSFCSGKAKKMHLKAENRRKGTRLRTKNSIFFDITLPDTVKIRTFSPSRANGQSFTEHIRYRFPGKTAELRTSASLGSSRVMPRKIRSGRTFRRQKEFPEIQEFGMQNMWNMARFYTEYCTNGIIQPLVAEIGQ